MSATDHAEQAMPGTDTPSAEIVKRTASTPHALDRVPLMTDDEIRRSWRLAVSLSASGMFKDARQAEQAFAKMLVGRDLGLTPTQALMGLHFVEGKIEIAAVMMATFVRSRDGYDYKVIKHTADGCAIEFFVDDESRGVSTFTIADAQTAGLTRDRGSAKSNYVKYPRNMLFARAMSNGCKWLIPEALAGIPVYVEGEIEAQQQLSDGQGDGQPVGLDLGPDVEKVISRAEALGHAGLADRGTIEMTLGDQPPAKVVEWVRAANRELDDIPADAEIVADAQEAPVSAVAAQTPVPTPVADNASHAPAQAGETGETAPDPERIEALRRRGAELLAEAEALRDAGDERADEVFEEFEQVASEVDAACNIDQGRLGF